MILVHCKSEESYSVHCVEQHSRSVGHSFSILHVASVPEYALPLFRLFFPFPDSPRTIIIICTQFMRSRLENNELIVSLTSVKGIAICCHARSYPAISLSAHRGCAGFYKVSVQPHSFVETFSLYNTTLKSFVSSEIPTLAVCR